MSQDISCDKIEAVRRERTPGPTYHPACRDAEIDNKGLPGQNQRWLAVSYAIYLHPYVIHLHPSLSYTARSHDLYYYVYFNIGPVDGVEY